MPRGRTVIPRAERYIGLSDISATTEAARSPGREAYLQLAASGVGVVEQRAVPDTGLPGLAVWTFAQTLVESCCLFTGLFTNLFTSLFASFLASSLSCT